MGWTENLVRWLTGTRSIRRDTMAASPPLTAEAETPDPAAAEEAAREEALREWDRQAAEHRAQREAEFREGAPARNAER